jgi:hypothetical protein
VYQGTFAIVGSGQFQAEGHEAEVYRLAAERMKARGYRTQINVPVALRAAHEVAGADEVNARVKLLASDLAQAAAPDQDLVVLASSLGCDVAIQALCELEKNDRNSWRSARLVLIGFVAEEPIALPESVCQVLLLTGDQDFIQYAEADGTMSPVRHAAEHHAETLRHLHTEGVEARGEILKGRDHLLAPAFSSSDQPTDSLEVIVQRIT